MVTIIILLLIIIILYLHQYLLMAMKWMYITLYLVNMWVFFISFHFIFFSFFFFSFNPIPGDGGARVMWWCLECQGQVCHKDIIALENGHLLPFQKKKKKIVYEWKMSACEKNADIWVFDSILVLLKSVLIFHRWGFYGTDSIHEKSDGQSYFSSAKSS